MKSFEVQYMKGHLIDTKTNKRVFLKRGGVFNILGDDDQFQSKDELQINFKPLNTDDKLKELEKGHPDFFYHKIADAGQKFAYRIGLSKTTTEEKEREFLFEADILEDLYIISKDTEKWSLYDCKCKTENCLHGTIQMIETVRGRSLNNLFSNMVAFYFPLQRSGACNAFDTFFFTNINTTPTLTQLKGGYLQSLNDSRKKVLVI